MDPSFRRPPAPRPPVKLPYEPADDSPDQPPLKAGPPLILAGAAAMGACYLLLLLLLGRAPLMFSNLLWDLGVACILGVPVAAGAGITLGWGGLFGRRFRWTNATVFGLASLAMALYTVFWIMARSTV